ncbi:NUDIX domain-containing protein [Kineosporia sp. J2-2]|uniref:NUDIX domain-containing protein n=1 Tax=Kineosporia corallincola TaxID=2835133 RepID=A0ABS5TBW5_9ACTN|nr:NUDIX domain-containing protein [Kineosporia corallincola]MBT0768571.1 NUDIX domain-containing protein [Kineosporia corallincola]
MADEPLYKTDPTAWNALLAEGNAKQARKRVSADVLIRDSQNRVLLVQPSYKPGWDLPGGMAEANEPPHEAAIRELQEELGLSITIQELLCLDWVSPHGPWDDLLAFVFAAVVADHGAGLDDLRPHDAEILSARFFPIDQAEGRLKEALRTRLAAAWSALGSGRTAYLIDGRPA